MHLVAVDEDVVPAGLCDIEEVAFVALADDVLAGDDGDGHRAVDDALGARLEELGLDQDTDADEEKGLKKGAGAAAAEERVVVALPLCMHAFHKECIYSWLAVNRSCPLCRMDVTQASGAADV